MCTLLTVSAGLWSRALENHIRRDAENNPHGFSLLLLSEYGAETILRSMDINVILSTLRNSEWTRMFLHSRYATQGSVRLDNTHGWSEDGVFYMHNGCLTSKDSWSYEVDSQAIGEWIKYGGIDRALAELRSEMFANVFMIDVNDEYFVVSKSASGSLYTDGQGNYATVPFADICSPVVPGTVDYWWYGDAVASEPAAPADAPLSSDYTIDDDGLDDLPPATDEELERYQAWLERGILPDDDGIGDYVSPSLRAKRRA